MSRSKTDTSQPIETAEHFLDEYQKMMRSLWRANNLPVYAVVPVVIGAIVWLTVVFEDITNILLVYWMVAISLLIIGALLAKKLAKRQESKVEASITGRLMPFVNQHDGLGSAQLEYNHSDKQMTIRRTANDEPYLIVFDTSWHRIDLVHTDRFDGKALVKKLEFEPRKFILRLLTGDVLISTRSNELM